MADDSLTDALMRQLRQEFGRQGGLARAKKLTTEQQSAIAKKASRARWKKYRKEKKGAAA